MPSLARFLVLSLLFSAAPLAAQGVRGTLVASPGGGPVSGALVTLLDARGVAVDTAQSDAGGRFGLRARAPGAYRVRAERVGYAAAFSPSLALGAGETRELRLEATAAAAMLEGLQVTAPERECVVDPRGGARTAALWDEARKSLELAEWAHGRASFLFTLRGFQRELEPVTLTVKKEATATRTARSSSPYVSLPAEDLAEKGYVRAEGTDSRYYSPDARVLLSDVFLDRHCFRVQPGRVEGQVGLAFEPVRGQRLPDVRGVLWLDAATAELASVEYAYTGLPAELSGEGDWGGRLEFERLPDGAVIVRRWRIRMPQLGRVAVAGGSLHSGPRTRVVAVREEGAEVVDIADASGRVARAGSSARVRGVAFDSTRARPLAGAVVFLAGTPYSATADAAGSFVIADVPEGRYALTFSHPRADSLGFVPGPAPVEVGTSGEVTAAVAIPREAADRSVAADVRAGPGARVAGDTAVHLEEIMVAAERQARVLRLSGFYDRKRNGLGAFIAPEDLRKRGPGRLSDLLQGVRGIHGRPHGSVGRVFSVQQSGRRCWVPVYVDGILVNGGTLDHLRPEQVAGIEVYVGAETPARFLYCQTCDSVCGAIVVWTEHAST